MIPNRSPRSSSYQALSLGAYAATVAASLACAAFAPHLATFAPQCLVATGAVFVLALWGIPIRAFRVRRSDFTTDAYFFDSPVLAAIFAFAGPVPAAAVALLGYGCAAAFRPRSRTDLLRQGAARALIALLLMPAHDWLFGLVVPATARGGATFVAVLFAATATVAVLEAPFAAWRIGLPVRWVLRRHFSDPIYWWCGGLTTLWAYLVVSLWPGASLLLLAALWAPPIVLQILASMNDEQRAEIERLRLERSVIRAVASGSDPVAQIAFTLRSFAGPESGETFAIYIHESEGGWRHVASVGSAPSPQAVDASGQMLRRLGADGSTALRMFDGFSVWAKAIEDGEGRDATAALVVTCTGSPNGNDIEHYVSAGHGIAPLVRELRLLTSIQDAASTDALTRLRNRKTVLRQLDALLLDGSGDVAIMMIDADYFARINNELGHLAGDRCLQSIAGAIKDAVRDDDVTGRYGGEEFIVVMPAASPAGAAAVAERIRAAVRNCGARYASGEAVTVSIGLAWAAAGETRQALIDRADRALYRAKSAGRDCVVEAAPHELPRA